MEASMNKFGIVALLAAVVIGGPAWAQGTTSAKADKASQTFLTKAIEGNYAEVEMGKLAQQNGQSAGVKSFGQMLASDHGSANGKAIAAAKEMGVTAPGGPNAKQKKDYDKMAKMTGAAFDKAFARHMVADHKKDISEYQKEARKKDAAGQYAEGALPTLKKHLETAQSLGKSAAR
jgi:putative membrane protein